MRKLVLWKGFICLTETRINANTIDNNELIGYNFFHVDSPTAAGGAGIFISNCLPIISRPDIKFHIDSVESCWIEINPVNGGEHIIIGCIYKHPGVNIYTFSQEMESILKQLNELKYKVFILGDINIDFLKYNSHSPTENYLDMLYRI